MMEGGAVSFCGRLLQDWSVQECQKRVVWRVCTMNGRSVYYRG